MHDSEFYIISDLMRKMQLWKIIIRCEKPSACPLSIIHCYILARAVELE